jgi:hypothetical protein
MLSLKRGGILSSHGGQSIVHFTFVIGEELFIRFLPMTNEKCKMNNEQWSASRTAIEPDHSIGRLRLAVPCG